MGMGMHLLGLEFQQASLRLAERIMALIIQHRPRVSVSGSFALHGFMSAARSSRESSGLHVPSGQDWIYPFLNKIPEPNFKPSDIDIFVHMDHKFDPIVLHVKKALEQISRACGFDTTFDSTHEHEYQDIVAGALPEFQENILNEFFGLKAADRNRISTALCWPSANCLPSDQSAGSMHWPRGESLIHSSHLALTWPRGSVPYMTFNVVAVFDRSAVNRPVIKSFDLTVCQVTLDVRPGFDLFYNMSQTTLCDIANSRMHLTPYAIHVVPLWRDRSSDILVATSPVEVVRLWLTRSGIVDDGWGSVVRQLSRVLKYESRGFVLSAYTPEKQDWIRGPECSHTQPGINGNTSLVAMCRDLEFGLKIDVEP